MAEFEKQWIAAEKELARPFFFRCHVKCDGRSTEKLRQGGGDAAQHVSPQVRTQSILLCGYSDRDCDQNTL